MPREPLETWTLLLSKFSATQDSSGEESGTVNRKTQCTSNSAPAIRFGIPESTSNITCHPGAKRRTYVLCLHYAILLRSSCDAGRLCSRISGHNTSGSSFAKQQPPLIPFQ